MKTYRLPLLFILGLFSLWACDDIQERTITPQTPATITDDKTFYVSQSGRVAIEVASVLKTSSTASLRLEKDGDYGNANFSRSGLVVYQCDSTVVDADDYFVLRVNDDKSNIKDRMDTIRIKIKSEDHFPLCFTGAQQDRYEIKLNTVTKMNVLENDRFCQDKLDSTTLSIIEKPLIGTVEIKNNRIIYTPKKDTEYADLFYYRICSVAATGKQPLCLIAAVLVKVVSNTPKPCKTILVADAVVIPKNSKEVDIRVLGNDLLCPDYQPSIITLSKTPKNGTALVKDNKVYYKPNTDFVGVEELEYQLCDKTGANCQKATIKILVADPNPICVPNLGADAFTFVLKDITSDGNYKMDVLKNDVACKGDNFKDLKIGLVGTGTLKVESMKLLYIPKTKDWTGEDKFTYQVVTDKGVMAVGVGTIKITK
jgi:hypothetical protein